MEDLYSHLALKELGIDENKFTGKNKKSIALGMNLEEHACAFLQDKFIEKQNYRIFAEKFAQAISGDGNELLKMNAVKSSSLCSLLFFYNVNNDKEHSLTIYGKTYTKSYFEYKNKVYKNPSNMDVVLTNDEGDILFIECKFSEYLEHDKPEISSTYFTNEQSKHIMSKLIESGMLKEIGKNKYEARYENNPIYATGLKQIVAHYIGVNYFKNKQYYKCDYYDDRNNIQTINNQKVRFVEVLFDLGKELVDYRNASDYLINNIINGQETFLSSITYQEILRQNKDYKLDENVKTFYKYIY